jgi:hypothetical protein
MGNHRQITSNRDAQEERNTPDTASISKSLLLTEHCAGNATSVLLHGGTDMSPIM